MNNTIFFCIIVFMLIFFVIPGFGALLMREMQWGYWPSYFTVAAAFIPIFGILSLLLAKISKPKKLY